MPEETRLIWHRVAQHGELPENRVTTVVAGTRSIALTHFEGTYSALDNACPHQGGPLGEGAIENGWLRCPWHGWDFHPCTGLPPGGFEDGVPTYPVEVRDDGIYVGLEETAARVETVSDRMAETLVAWGVDTVFGMVGHSNLGLADALRRQEERGRLRFFAIRHEGAAAFAASAYGKLTGRPAACFAIAGPGATNLLTGLWDAKMDRSPVLAMVGQVDAQVLGPGAFQEVDLASAFEAVSGWGQTVYRDSKHAELMNLALKNASLRRDVAHLIFPNEVQTLPASEGAAPGSPEGRVSEARILPPRAALERSIEKIRAARRPAIIVGHGARFDMPAIVRLAESLKAPVLTTFKAKGQIPDDHPLACGVLGRSGTFIASHFMNESDLLIVLGASFSNHTGITPKKPIVQVDFERMALGKFHAVDVPVWGEISATVGEWLDAFPEGTDSQDPSAEIAGRWQIWRTEKSRRAQDDRGNGLNSASIFSALSEAAPEDAVITVDVGNNAYSFGRYFECRRHSVLMSGYLGSIGFGYPAAMGAWAAAPERKVIAVTGDGGFAQYMGELTTAVRYGMNITHVLLNNSELGKITKEQRAGRFEVWKTDLHNPDFSRFAENCGALGLRVRRKSELDTAFAQALAHPGPSLVEILADPELI
ncbi:MAG: Rieske 2Fe-2S domain-containing protein [Proteobacteria bacterium]|nr:Rieske 2Fe-2S domain-containing protein [Pseudomonadota bacterium]